MSLGFLESLSSHACNFILLAGDLATHALRNSSGVVGIASEEVGEVSDRVGFNTAGGGWGDASGRDTGVMVETVSCGTLGDDRIVVSLPSGAKGAPTSAGTNSVGAAI